jgi:hypothetical protein
MGSGAMGAAKSEVTVTSDIFDRFASGRNWSGMPSLEQQG